MKIEEILEMRDNFKNHKFVENMIKHKWRIYRDHNNGYDRDLIISYLYKLYDRIMYDDETPKELFWMTNASGFHRILSLYRGRGFIPLTMKDNNIYFLDSPVIFASVPQDNVGRIYLVDVLRTQYDSDLNIMEAIDNQPYYGVIEDLI